MVILYVPACGWGGELGTLMPCSMREEFVDILYEGDGR